MNIRPGYPLPLGATCYENYINFAVEGEMGGTCTLLLYKKGCETPFHEIPMEQEWGAVHCVAVEGIAPEEYEYNFLMEDEILVDPYGKAIAGKSSWGEKRSVENHEIRTALIKEDYDWEGDLPLHLPLHEVIAYSLHVRGFTAHSSSKVKKKGTFTGFMEKIPYLVDLGINQVQLMPIYEFEECLLYTNYWGYGEGYFFTPKAAYAATKDPVKEFKNLVKACHKAGIEVVLKMPFADNTPKGLMMECLRYYTLEYHIDGFVLNAYRTPMEMVESDAILKGVKILTEDLGFQIAMRKFLKGDEGMVREVIYWLKQVSTNHHFLNAITGQTGFTLQDLVSYDGKHNEGNGENNQDGPEYNYSWNCGVEGPTRKKPVVALREQQMRNAFALLLLSQGTPCILAGDEFGNSQKGNNNVYCQDNAISWLNWKQLEKNKELHDYVKELIALRKNYGVFHPEREYLGIDQNRCGIPDISYHGEYAWQVPSEISSRILGVYYSGAGANCEDLFVAYNMHWEAHDFALPSLPKGKKWNVLFTTRKQEEPLDTVQEDSEELLGATTENPEALEEIVDTVLGELREEILAISGEEEENQEELEAKEKEPEKRGQRFVEVHPRSITVLVVEQL